MRLDLVIPGEPRPQPRHEFRVVGKGENQWVQAYLPKDHPIHAWKARIQGAARRWIDGQQFAGPIRIYLEFRMPRPQAHFNKGGLKNSAPTWHSNEKGDLDNLTKAVMDALTDAEVWTGDGLVCQLRAEKRYVRRGEPIGCRVVIEHVNQDDELGLFSEFSQEATA